MNKFLALLGVASMLAVTPAMAATAYKSPAPVKHHAAMCMVHGKKVACKKHTAHKTMKKHHVAAKKAATKVASKKK